MECKLLTFGSPMVLCDGEPVKLARRKSMALFIYLALNPQTHQRDFLATLLYPDADDQRARSGLRRLLADINGTPLGEWVVADRHTIAVEASAKLRVDVQEFEALTQAPHDESRLREARQVYRGHFLAGFTLPDADPFTTWQMQQETRWQHRYITSMLVLAEMCARYDKLEDAVATAQQVIAENPLHEDAHAMLIRFYTEQGQRQAAIAQYERLKNTLKDELDIEPSSETRELFEMLMSDEGEQPKPPPGVLPHRPGLVVGRETALNEIKQRLGVMQFSTDAVQVIVQGWPGIGKTTLTAAIAHDPDVQRHFPDGILWASLGENPSVQAELANWGRAMGYAQIENAKDADEASHSLRSFLQDKRILLIVDDVWQAEHALPLFVHSKNGALLLTTRMNGVARRLAAASANIYKLPILSIEQSVALMQHLTPETVAQHPEAVRQLASDLEGLPLALQVAGRLLHAEMAMGWGVQNLLGELRETARLLDERAPVDRYNIAEQTTPTIAALLQRSIERLSVDVQQYFALLGVFAPKPARFNLGAMQAVWQVDEPQSIVHTLVNRGLLEPLGGGDFQIHALMVMQAQTMFEA